MSNKNVSDKVNIIEYKLSRAKDKADVLSALRTAIDSNTRLQYNFALHKLVSFACIPAGFYVFFLGASESEQFFILSAIYFAISYIMYRHRKGRLEKLKKVEKISREIVWIDAQDGTPDRLNCNYGHFDYSGFSIAKSDRDFEVQGVYNSQFSGPLKTFQYTYVKQYFLEVRSAGDNTRKFKKYRYHFIFDTPISLPALICSYRSDIYKDTLLAPQKQFEACFKRSMRVFGDESDLHSLLSAMMISIIDFIYKHFDLISIEIKDDGKMCISIANDLFESLGSVGIEDTSNFYKELSSGLETSEKMQMMLTCMHDLLLQLDKVSAESEEAKSA